MSTGPSAASGASARGVSQGLRVVPMFLLANQCASFASYFCCCVNRSRVDKLPIFPASLIRMRCSVQ